MAAASLGLGLELVGAACWPHRPPPVGQSCYQGLDLRGQGQGQDFFLRPWPRT